MPDGSNLPSALLSMSTVAQSGTAPRLAGRHSRPPVIAFVTDAATESAVSDGVSDVIPGDADVRRGGVRAAIAAMQTATTPSILIIDVSGEDEPFRALSELA